MMIKFIFLLIFLIWNVDEVKGVKDDVSGSGIVRMKFLVVILKLYHFLQGRIHLLMY